MRPRTTAQKGQIAAELREKVWPVLDAGSLRAGDSRDVPAGSGGGGAQTDGVEQPHRQDHDDSGLKYRDWTDRTAGAADDRQRARGEQEAAAAGFGERLQHQALQQRNTEIADQSLMDREHGAGGERQDLDGEVVGADDRDLPFREP